MNSNRVAYRLRQQIDYFSGELSKGLPKSAKRFVKEMVYGIQARQSVMLTEVARALEEPIRLKKSHDRLSRQLSRQGLAQVLNNNLLARACKHIRDDTLLIIDPTDISKKYAKHMQYLSKVRDGSTGQISDGYWVCSVVGAEVGSDEIIPLYQHLYSAEAPEFISENAEILKCVDTLSSYMGDRGIWVMDRGGDRSELIKPFLEGFKKFLIRLVGNRHLIHGGKTGYAEDIASGCRCPYTETVVKEEKGKERVFHIDFGFRKVFFPGYKEPLYLLVIKGFGQDPLMLLTNTALRRSRKVLWKMVKRYLRRWAVEETIRFWKQSYDVENIRVLGYRSLQNMMSLILVVSYFAARVLDVSSKLKITAAYVLQSAKRVFGIPDFRYYAIADGVRNLFMRHPGKPYRQFNAKWVEPSPQRQLF